MHRPRSVHLPARQRGLALLVLLALFATAAAYLLVSSLNKGSVALSLAKAEKNRAVLQEAKAALIAWSASQVLTATRPGTLPCPDRNNDGVAEPTCGSANRLGRLPYNTLGIGELRDASGELLWYGLSGNFRNYTGTHNSDTQGTLTISGLAPATNAVAVVLAPGLRLGTQDRGWTGASCSLTTDPCNIASNYLEGINGDTTTTDYVAAIENLTDSVTANLFNDQLLVITREDLLSAVEPVIAARIQRDIVLQYIYNSDASLTDSGNVWSDTATNRNKSRYFDAWGGFPFAATFANPGSSSFTGVANTYEGLFPVVDPGTLTWTTGSGYSIAKTGGTGTVVGTPSCAATTAINLICSITWSGFGTAPVITMYGAVNNVGLGFVQLPQLSDVSIGSGSLTNRTLTGSLPGTPNVSAGRVTLVATLPTNFSFFNKTSTVTISNANLIASPLISIVLTDVAGWFNYNQWYKQSYYAVSPGYAPGGGGACGTCLSVYNLSSPYANPTTDTRAILILAGRSLSGTTRPNSTLSDYLEAKNASTGDYQFEHGLAKTTLVAGSSTAINDKVIVVAP